MALGKTVAFRDAAAAAAAGVRRTHESEHPLDWRYAQHTRRLGFESLQILEGNPKPFGRPTRPAFELLIASRPCMRQPTALATSCVPLPLRTGWNASRACPSCSEKAPVLSCGLRS